MKRLITVVAAVALAACGSGAPAVHETKVIAHRGYWKADGSAQNSLASLRKAAEIGCYGTEFDVHLTADGVAIVNHDDRIGGAAIWEDVYDTFSGHLLSNGEVIPTLRSYLEEGAKYPELKLIIEIKSAPDQGHESRSVTAVMDIVEELGVSEQVEYIAFSYHICREIVARDPAAKVAYLNGDKTPDELKADGIAGLDYNVELARNNPALFADARSAGISTNIWTVNEEADMREFISYGVDFITTDQPELALELAKAAGGEKR
ncbi:MAG: glycerophosphodiester phosphodiesterase [Alistipes sp.]|nr:glycerophosphodiester phosphodiesterase [Alistipes sp.]